MRTFEVRPPVIKRGFPAEYRDDEGWGVQLYQGLFVPVSGGRYEDDLVDNVVIVGEDRPTRFIGSGENEDHALIQLVLSSGRMKVGQSEKLIDSRLEGVPVWLKCRYYGQHISGDNVRCSVCDAGDQNRCSMCGINLNWDERLGLYLHPDMGYEEKYAPLAVDKVETFSPGYLPSTHFGSVPIALAGYDVCLLILKPEAVISVSQFEGTGRNANSCSRRYTLNWDGHELTCAPGPRRTR